MTNKAEQETRDPFAGLRETKEKEIKETESDFNNLKIVDGPDLHRLGEYIKHQSDIGAYLGTREGIKEGFQAITKTNTETVLEHLKSTILPWYFYVQNNPQDEVWLTKSAAIKIARSILPDVIRVVGRQTLEERLQQETEQGKDRDNDFSVVEGFQEIADRVDEVGVQVETNTAALKEMRKALEKPTEAGEASKIPIPEPRKFSGEDITVDVRMYLKQLERYLTIKRRPRAEWGSLAFAFVEKSAESVWSSELTELEITETPVSWDHFVEAMISYFGTQVPARETQVKYKTCKQTTTVADYVRRMKALVQLLEGTVFKPAVGDIMDRFVDNLHPEPREWVLQQAPAVTWYTSPKEVYMKALQWETNNTTSVVSRVQPTRVLNNLTRFKRPERSQLKRKAPYAGRERLTGVKRPKSDHVIPKGLYDKRIANHVCWKCGMEGHIAGACPVGYRDENGKKYPQARA